MNAPKLHHDIELKTKTTLRLGGIVPFFLEIHQEEELKHLPEIMHTAGVEFRILGGGSNLLIADESMWTHGEKHLDFGVIHINIQNENIPAFETFHLDSEKNLLPPLAKKHFKEKKQTKFIRTQIPAGMAIQKFLQLCMQNACHGLEGLVGIPGKIGGAIAMNAGAYDSEMAQVLETVTIFSPKNGFTTLMQKDFSTDYRHFSVKKHDNDYIICNASFIFPYQDSKIIKENMQKNLDSKKASQPINALTAGCVFKNPLSKENKTISAGKILDQLGFRGKTKGNMQFSAIHANFLENKGNGNTYDALRLLEAAANAVYQEFGIYLEKEVRIW